LRQGFLAEAARDPAHIVVVDATRDVQAVQADIRVAAQRILRPDDTSPTTRSKRA
jgi:thymidylate kinase